MDAKAGMSDRVANANVENGRVNLLLLSLVPNLSDAMQYSNLESLLI